MLIGNKIDEKEKRCVTTEAGEEFAIENGLKFIETSAKENTNVHLMFEMLTDLIMKHSSIQLVDDDNVSIEKPTQEDSKSSCC